jgi:flagellar basal body-associated protein FliL
MAENENEEEVKSKPPILKYVLIAFIVVFSIVTSVVVTTFFLGGFDANKDEEIERTLQQLEEEADKARLKADELVRGPGKILLDAP